jgi:putative aldouronate transport system substrate-binding protein
MRKASIVVVLLVAASYLFAGGTDEAGGDEGPATISALINMNQAISVEPDEMPSFQRWYEETGITVEWEVVRSDWDSRKNLVLSSNDLPDTFWGNRTLNIKDVANNRPQFVELNDFIEDSTYVARMFEEEPALRGLVTFPDGGIYSLPHRMPLRPDTFQGNYINKTWLDALGLDMPTTVEEYVDVLRAFRDEDPNGNGIADEIPWSFAGTGTSFGVWWFFGAYGMSNNVFDRFALIDGEPVFIPATDNYREAISDLRDIYAEGLIDEEIFITGDWSIWLPKSQQTDPTIMGVAGMWTINTLMGNANAENYVTMPPLRKEGYGDPIFPSNPVLLRSNPVTWVMTTAAENQEAAFRFIDHVYNPRESVQLYFGSYGVGTEEVGDRVDIVGPGDPEITYDAWLWTNGFGDMGPFYVSREFEQTINPNAWVSEKLEIDAIYQPYIEDEVYPQLIFSEEDNRDLAVIETDIVNLVENKMAAWITGEGDIDAEWDEYIEDLYDLGFERYMEIHSSRYEQYKQGN